MDFLATKTETALAPLITLPHGDPLVSPKFTMNIEVPTLHSKPFMRIINKDTLEETIIEESIFSAISGNDPSAFLEAKIELNVKKREFANLTDPFINLNYLSFMSSPRDLYFSSYATGVTILPTAILGWKPESTYEVDSPEPKWSLFFQDFERYPVASAAWDDLEGIWRLIEKMKDVESLQTQLALKSPEAAARLAKSISALRVSQEFKKHLLTVDLPEINARKIVKLLKADPTMIGLRDILYAKPQNQFRTISTFTDEKEIPLAIYVNFDFRYSTTEDAALRNRVEFLTGWTALPQKDAPKVFNPSSLLGHNLSPGFWLVPPVLLPAFEQFREGVPGAVEVGIRKSWF